MSASIASYRDIIKLCDNKTRIVIWYTGRGKNLNIQTMHKKDLFPCFTGNRIFIEQHKLLEKLPKNVLNVVIFDCCNNTGDTKHDTPDMDIQVPGIITTLFDFEGELLVNSAKRNHSAFCRSSDGSTFAINFLRKFNDTYSNTLQSLTQHAPSSIISRGCLNYEKYDKDAELHTKTRLATERKNKEALSSSQMVMRGKVDS